ncbi:hypothetical protein, partial [Pseudomonas aeruginosa]|uniref:hypothetical protein n=1 Tax=Pseudomonas aeruginosa TaxID=287 RepID=UPI002E8E7999|nr:hypothetical protein [Pseudomonas aeruginosa]
MIASFIVRSSLGRGAREHPVDHGFQIGIGNLRIGRHRDLAPIAHAAFAHLLDELGLRAGFALVLGGSVLVGRAVELAVDGVSAHAGVL